MEIIKFKKNCYKWIVFLNNWKCIILERTSACGLELRGYTSTTLYKRYSWKSFGLHPPMFLRPEHRDLDFRELSIRHPSLAVQASDADLVGLVRPSDNSISLEYALCRMFSTVVSNRIGSVKFQHVCNIFLKQLLTI